MTLSKIQPATIDAGGLAKPAAGATIVFGLLVWSYWPVIVPLWGDWRRDANYSVGMLVPLAALWIAWIDRARPSKLQWRPSQAGLAVLLIALVFRGLGQLLLFESLERYSLVIAVAGLVLLNGGAAAMRQFGGALLLLLLMVPLPGRVHNAISAPLQHTAVAVASQMLELSGISVLREGFALTIDNRATVNITEGCSGLRLFSAFAVIAAVFSLMVSRAKWVRWVLFASALPIAIVCNAMRIVITAVLCTVVSNRVAETFFHDFAGISMMPPAVLLLFAELRMLDWLTDRPRATGQGATAP